MAGNANLGAAKAAKNDEFYTCWRDIENEMNAYLDYNQDAFRGKTVLLPCDDPGWSNFTKYFALNFESMGIKRLISTSYAPGSNPSKITHESAEAEKQSPQYAPVKSWENGRIFVLEKGVDLTGDGRVDVNNIDWDYLDGDGDFRSEEVTALRDEADMVITNPPFSLYREFVAWLLEGEVEYSIIGNANSVTYREIFPLVKCNKMWRGATANSSDMVFEVPLTADVKESDLQKAARLGYPSTDDKKFTRLGNSCWFTNIEHGLRHEFLELMTMEDNIRYCRRKVVRERGYPKYDNYDAIEVSFTAAIPSDHGGVMGVPISFLDKYNPDQFEIVGCSHNYGRPHGWDSNVSMSAVVNGKSVYSRIFIRHKEKVGAE